MKFRRTGITSFAYCENTAVTLPSLPKLYAFTKGQWNFFLLAIDSKHIQGNIDMHFFLPVSIYNSIVTVKEFVQKQCTP